MKPSRAQARRAPAPAIADSPAPVTGSVVCYSSHHRDQVAI
jgi:hypothetical protein